METQSKIDHHLPQNITQHKYNIMMKLAPPILLLSTATAFAPSNHRPLLHGLYERPPVDGAVQDSTVDIDREVASFNIGEMPTSYDESAKKRQIAKVRYFFLCINDLFANHHGNY